MNISLDTFFAVVEQLKIDEGFDGFPYVDTTGHHTIGYGHNLDRPISKEAAEFILKDDLAEVLRDIDQHKPWWVELPTAAQRVIANMAYNLGWPRFKEFVKFWVALEHRQYKLSAAEIRNSLYARQVGARAERLAVLLESCANQEAI